MEEWTKQEREAFGERLRQARVARNKTQIDVGAMFDLTKQAVSSWEHGRNLPDVEQVARMAVEYEVSVEWLLYGRQVASLSPELVARLSRSDAEELHKAENSLRGWFGMPPLAPSAANQAPPPSSPHHGKQRAA